MLVVPDLVVTPEYVEWIPLVHVGPIQVVEAAFCVACHFHHVSVADGTPLAAEKLARALTADPGLGVVGHADAGYEISKKTASEHHLRIPMAE